MASQRDRITKLTEYLATQGITVNIGKTKARGNNGVFIFKKDNFRIDISQNTPDEKVLSVIVHEYAHFIHYKYDNKLSSLDFVFGKLSEIEENELLEVTVQSIPKDFAQKLCSEKSILQKQIKELIGKIQLQFPDFKVSKPNALLMKNLNICAKYLLKYDSVKYFGKIYNIANIKQDFPELTEEQLAYFQLKSKRRALNRLNRRISNLNKYYNKPSELFARFLEVYYSNRSLSMQLAPNLVKKMDENIKKNNITELEMLSNIIA